MHYALDLRKIYLLFDICAYSWTNMTHISVFFTWKKYWNSFELFGIFRRIYYEDGQSVMWQICHVFSSIVRKFSFLKSGGIPSLKMENVELFDPSKWTWVEPKILQKYFSDYTNSAPIALPYACFLLRFVPKNKA